MGAKWLPRKLTYEEVKEKFSDGGCVLLSESYEGKDAPLRYICNCGNESLISWNSFRGGHRCKNCGIAKQIKARNPEEIKMKIKQTYIQKRIEFYRGKGCELIDCDLSSEKLSYLCRCGKIHYKTFNAFKHCWKCDECIFRGRKEQNKLSLESVREIFRKEGCELISDTYFGYEEKLNYICSCGKRYEKSLASFKLNSRCYECYLDSKRGENNYNYKRELTDEQRAENNSRANLPEQRVWKKLVYIRDGHSCMCCGSSQSNFLQAHHLDGYNWCIEKRTDVENGATLCIDCHKDFHSLYGYGNNTREQFDEWLLNKQRKQDAM
jgi:hypothetical protein